VSDGKKAGVRFLHTSDWQLGMTRHYLAGEAQSRFSQARLDAIATMADLARERGCAFVVVAGDVFETNQPDQRTVMRALDRLARFDVPVYLLPGNHDPYDPSSIYRNPAFVDRCPAQVHVLRDATPHVPVEGVEVVGATWTSKEPLRDLVADACEASPADGVTRIVVGHGSVPEVSGSFDTFGAIALDRVEAAIAEGRVGYVALGDRHSCTAVGTSGRVRFSGAPEPTSYVEEDAGTALVVDLADDAVDVDRVVVGTWRYHTVDLPVDSDRDLDALEAALDAIGDPSRAIVRLKLRGTLDLRQAARLEDALERRRELFGALERPARHHDVAVRATAADLDDLPLTGYAAAARDVLQRAADGEGDAAAAATDALGLLLRLAAVDAAAQVAPGTVTRAA
jgi:DNA repair exonuclease SbcCD nuclease subunit